jgi:ribosomal protein S18 acetylase RimI-like enzyme
MIRKLTIDDYPDAVELWGKVGLEIRLNGRDNPNRVEKQLKSENVILLGKFGGGVLLGVVLVTHDGRKGWLNRLAVNPDYQRKGVAKELIISAEKLLFEEIGIEIYSALVSKENLTSNIFFESVGYEKWDEISYFSKRIRPDS